MNQKKLIKLVKNFIFLKHNVKGKYLMISFKDIDNDGIEEIIARYFLNDVTNLIILKNSINGWELFEEEFLELYPAYINAIDGKLWGYINNKGKFIIKPQFDYASDFENGKAIVLINNLFALINSDGEYIIEPTYMSMSFINESLIKATTDEGSVVIDGKGKIISKTYAYIGTFSDDLAQVANKDFIYGYINKNGIEIIPLVYQEVFDFVDQKAIVKDFEKYNLINTSGDIIHTYDYYFVGYYNEGLMAFIKSQNGLYGFINELGEVIIKPQYTDVFPFKNNIAIVNIEKDLINHYGIINKFGEIVVPLIYNNIIDLNENRFALGKAIQNNKPFLGSIYAVSDNSGKIITDFIFDEVNEYLHHIASVSNSSKTFFIDLNGNQVKSLPIVDGFGKLEIKNSLISAQIDYIIYYLDKLGNIINYPNYIIPGKDEVDVIINKYKPNKNYLVYYPHFENIMIFANTNQLLKKLSLVRPIPFQRTYRYYGNFTIKYVKKDLMEIQFDGYKYNFGSAHCIPYRQYAHINLITGDLYSLEDLFKEDADYSQELILHVKRQIKNDNNIYYLPGSDLSITNDQLFYVTNEAIHLFYNPCEIAAYVTGYPEFIINFEEINEIINKDSDFWKSFH